MEIINCWRCKNRFVDHEIERHKAAGEGVEVDDVWMCESCIKLMDGYYNDPMTGWPIKRLIQRIKDLELALLEAYGAIASARDT